MAVNQTIDFKDPLWILKWLDTALNKEKEKYSKCPVTPDCVPGHHEAEGWGYVVAGYFLVEQSFKALIFVRGNKEVPKIHSLSELFDLLDHSDKDTLREYYDDFKATIGGKIGVFPFVSLDDFLLNLDGNKDAPGKSFGPLDWRYYLMEESHSIRMPIVSVDYLHEVVYGSCRILEFAINRRFKPDCYTRSWRMRWQRKRKYQEWLTVRMNTEGWESLGDRLEILWGPDYLDRYDLYIFKDQGGKQYFSKIPENSTLPIIDKRAELAGSAAAPEGPRAEHGRTGDQ